MTAAVHDHQVAYYETAEHLTQVASGFLSAALRSGDAAVVVATPQHAARFRTALARDGVDLDAALDDGRLVVLDAVETLATFIDGGIPDRARFRKIVTAVLDTASAGGTRDVRVYGEMVALLWADGLVPAAIELEDLWNELAAVRRFSLLCAYPVAVFDRDASTEPFRIMCSKHSHVIPNERASRLDDAMARTMLERKQAELETAVELLREIDEMRNKFVAMVVHDIRSPAIVVRGYLGLLADTWTELAPDQIHSFLRTSVENIKQIEHLADDMTTVARLESGTFTYERSTFSLTGLVHRVVDEVRVSAERNIDTSDVAAQPRVLADERRQRQILANLLSNAVKFSPAASTITVTLTAGSRELTVRVSDQGPGLTVAQVAVLFRPFSRLSAPETEAVKGTGLGLYIAKALVEGQGGSIWVESEPGAGATFAYTVPLA